MKSKKLKQIKFKPSKEFTPSKGIKLAATAVLAVTTIGVMKKLLE